MNSGEFDILKSLYSTEGISISVSDVEESGEGLGDRTLLYGHTSSKFFWHIYFKNGKINKVVHSDKSIISHDAFESVDPRSLIPNKGLYPEACDYSFCMLLLEMRIELPFLNFDHNRPKRVFYGLTA